jgi:attachment invasion locus protein
MNIYMTKLLWCGLLCGILSATSAFAAQFSGSRLGVGGSETSLAVNEGESFDYGTGFKLEYGYDFNQVIGVSISYENNDDTIDGVKLSGLSNKISYDLGYAFPLQAQTVFLKPYGKFGLVFYSEESSLGTSFDTNDVFLGGGVRFQIGHFYADLSLDYFVLEDLYWDQKLEFTQTAFTLGYRF